MRLISRPADGLSRDGDLLDSARDDRWSAPRELQDGIVRDPPDVRSDPCLVRPQGDADKLGLSSRLMACLLERLQLTPVAGDVSREVERRLPIWLKRRWESTH